MSVPLFADSRWNLEGTVLPEGFSDGSHFLSHILYTTVMRSKVGVPSFYFYFVYLFIYLCWGVVDLQYYISFRYTT